MGIYGTVFCNHIYTMSLRTGIKSAGHEVQKGNFFDTINVKPKDLGALKEAARSHQINLRYFEDGSVGVSLDDTVEEKDVNSLLEIFGCDKSAVSCLHFFCEFFFMACQIEYYDNEYTQINPLQFLLGTQVYNVYM